MEDNFGSISEKEITADEKNPIDEYLEINRYGAEGFELQEGQSIKIPLNNFESMEFNKETGGWMTDRNANGYDVMLFNDQYEDSEDFRIPSNLKADSSSVISGGKESAFAPGKKVLELGSGEAIALLEYSKQFPDTTFIGVDSGYRTEVPVDLSKTGVQLTKEDWSALSSIPDQSIDTILSCQGALMWGVGDGGYITTSLTEQTDNTPKLVETMTRIAKPGAVLRFDSGPEDKLKHDHVKKILEQHGWGVNNVGLTTVAVKNS